MARLLPALAAAFVLIGAAASSQAETRTFYDARTRSVIEDPNWIGPSNPLLRAGLRPTRRPEPPQVQEVFTRLYDNRRASGSSVGSGSSMRSPRSSGGSRSSRSSSGSRSRGSRSGGTGGS